MRIITREQSKSVKSVFLCREMDPEHLGREVYADNIETPYSFYLIRKLNLARDYQNLAEGEAFFDAICDSWDETSEFDELVVKKIYMYVETEIMYYTILFGSFDPVNRSQKTSLKEWIASVSLEKTDRTLVHGGSVSTNNEELKIMMKQLMETSNEIFRLRKIINDLNDTMSVAKIETNAEAHPVISRSIRTIHLKRAQPIILDEEEGNHGEVAVLSDEPAGKNSSDKSEIIIEKVEVTEDTEDSILAEPETDVAEKKSESEVAEEKEPVLEDTQKEDEASEIPVSSKKQDLDEGITEIEQEDTPVKTKRQKLVLSNQEKISKNKERKKSKKLRKDETQIKAPALTKHLILKKRKTRKATPSNWPRFSRLLKASKVIDSPKRIPDFSKSDLENLEDEIYLQFMNKRVRGLAKKNHSQKRSISRPELLSKIGQAEYLNYSWGQVLKQRKEDVLICGRLSCASLVANLDEFLQEIREVAYSRSLFGKKVRCSVDMLRKLEGYILMDQYMQKLSLASENIEERKGYF